MLRISYLMAILTLGSLCVFAADTSHQVDLKADQLFQSMSRALASQSSIEAQAHATARMRGNGILQEMSTTYSIAIERPNKLAIRNDTRYLGSTVITDGTTLTRYNLSDNTYKAESAPAELESV